jgi:hypothetical protein
MKCIGKNASEPVIQLEIEIARASCHQLLRRQLHLPESRPSKTPSKFQEETRGCQDSQQNVSEKMHLIPVIQLEIKISRARRHQILRRQ